MSMFIRIPNFGEELIDVYASDDNPRKHFKFVRTIYKRGKINPCFLVTDGSGNFWEVSPDACKKRANP